MTRRRCEDCDQPLAVCRELGGCELPPCKPEADHSWCSPRRCEVARDMERRDNARELAEEHRVDAYIDRMRGC